MTTTTIAGLTGGASYHYRLVATNSAGTSYGYDYMLQTLSPPPVNTTPPAISGTAQQGASVITTLGTWSGAITTETFQWQRSADNGTTWTNIAGATGMSYTPVSADIGDTLRANVTVGNQAGSATASTTALGPVTSGAPANTVPPAIAGQPKQGQVLTVSSTWNPSATLTYQWQRSTNGTTWSAISGATGISYTAQTTDEGATLRTVVSASNSFGQASATSPAVGPVTADPPVNTVAPVMSGTTQRTYTLTSTQGTWTGTGNVYSYQWQRSLDGVTWTSISGATAPSYTLAQSDEGTVVRVLVSASNPDGVVSQASNATATIISPYPPQNTAPPVISGTATRTSTLSASTGTWTGPGLSYAYQWQEDAGNGYANIPGATNSTYTLQASDENMVVRVVIAATNIDQTIMQASQATAVVQDAEPVSINAPTVTGTALRGQTLSGTQGTWGGLGNSYAYQWQRSTDGQTWTNVTGASGLTYAVAQSDEGSALRLQVTASNADGSAVAQSQPTATVPNSAPANSAAPTITGSAERGYVLSGTQGTWTGIGNTYSYQWQRSSGQTWTNITGATGTSYMLAVADENASVRLLVSATNPDGTLAVASAPSATVQSAAPANGAPPVITGSAQRGNVLTGSQGTWTGLANTYAYQWQRSTDGRGWTNVTGATGSSYTLAKADEGSQLRVQVTAANLDGTLAVPSAPTVWVPTAPPLLTAAPTITGNAQRTFTLSATQGTWSGIGNSYAYQWQHSTDNGATWTNIAGATGSTNPLGVADEATMIRVQVSASNVDGQASAASAAAGPVQAAAPVNIAAPAITGTVQRGQTLSGSQGTWSGIGNGYAYQWQRSADGSTWANITGATTAAYRLAIADEHDTIRLQVTASNPDAPAGVSAASTATATVPSAPPVNTTAPALTGTAQRASVLSGSQGTWSGIGNSYAYQWQRSADGSTWANITGATSATYTLAVADESAAVRVLVTATNPDAPAGVSAPSAPSATIPAAPPVNTVAPSITGTAQRASVLTGTQGTWTGVGNGYAYQWQRRSGSGWTNITGATTTSYTLAVADENATVRMLVTATNPDGTVSLGSTPTATVPSAPPVNTVAPKLTGTAQRTSTLTGTQGTWTGIGNSYAYQWQRSSDGQSWSAITAATAVTYTLTQSDEGYLVRFQVTVSNADGTLAVASTPTTKVLGAPPVNTLAPTLTGTAQRTSTLTGTQGTWTGIGNSYTYQWQRSADGQTWANILGATTLSYKLAVADEHQTVRLQVTATNADGAVSVASPASTAVQTAPPLSTVAPTISGTAQRTNSLTLSSTGTWTGPDNSYADQWQRSADGTTWTNITGATGQNYTLTVSDEGDQVRALVNATNPDAPAGIGAGSKASAVVQGAPPVNTVLPSITGAAQRGTTLSASKGTWSGPDNTYAYQWQHSTDAKTWTAITSQTSTTYTLSVSDEGSYVRMLVTATNPDAPTGVGAASVATSAVAAIPPQNTVAPSISGSARLGAALSANPGNWTPSGATFAYQWQRSTDGQAWTNITGAGVGAYTLTATDVGQIVRVIVTATNVDGSQTATSSATAAVTRPPKILGAPNAPSGTLHDTYTLNADPGTWDTATGVSYGYTWMRCPASATSITSACTQISSGATTYTLTSSDVGSTIGVNVTATSTGGTSVPVASALTAVITGRPQTNTAAPSITGTPQVPNTLQANPGTWSVPTTSVTYVWQRCDADGASNCMQVAASGQHTLSGADNGHTLVLYATATSPGQSTTAHSTALSVTAQPLPQATVAPTVSGTAQRTFTLSSTQGTWTNNPTLHSQWQRCDASGQNCVSIAGATGVSYALVQADEGHKLTIQVTATNSSGTTVANAQPTNAIAADPPLIIHVPAVTGIAYEQDIQIGIVPGSASFLQTIDTTTATSWQRCDTAGQNCATIPGATNGLYTPTSVDAGHTLVAVVTATNPDASVPSPSKPTPVISTAGPRWKTLPLISNDPGHVGDSLTITPGVFTGPKVDTDVVQMMRCTNMCVGAGQAGSTSYTILSADLGAVLRVQETASNSGGSVSLWSARYVGPVISAAAGSGVLENASSISVRNTNGQALATAQMQTQVSADVARDSAPKHPATRVVKLRRARGITGKLEAWICPAPVGSAPPASCSAKISLQSAATLKLTASMSAKLQIVVVRHGH